MIKQLVHIVFMDVGEKQEAVEVDWYHVPRHGDHIEFAEPSQMVGRVVGVVWTEDEVTVRIK